MPTSARRPAARCGASTTLPVPWSSSATAPGTACSATAFTRTSSRAASSPRRRPGPISRRCARRVPRSRSGDSETTRRSMRITRREFEIELGAALAAGTLGAAGCARPPKEQRRSEAAVGAQPPLRMTRGRADLTVPAEVPAGESWRYGLAFLFQVAPRRAALFANIRGKRGHDFEVGTDVVLFDDAERISSRGAVVVSRNEILTNPKSSPAGKPAILVKFPIRGGFVPLGAKRSDGASHPHAGTGFGAAQVEGWTADRDAPFRGAETYEYMELHQFAYDGTTFRVTVTERVPFNRLLAGDSL